MQPLWNQGSGNSTGSRSLTQSGVHEVEWSPLEGGAWSQSSPWRDTSLEPRRRTIIAGVGLGLLSILAFAGALSRKRHCREPFATEATIARNPGTGIRPPAAVT